MSAIVAPGSSLAFGWLSILVIFIISWAFRLVPVPWYGVRDWLFPVLVFPFIGLAAVNAYRTRSATLGIMTAVAIFFPVIIIVAGMLLWGV